MSTQPGQSASTTSPVEAKPIDVQEELRRHDLAVLAFAEKTSSEILSRSARAERDRLLALSLLGIALSTVAAVETQKVGDTNLTKVTIASVPVLISSAWALP